jgi:hypothetical protein
LYADFSEHTQVFSESGVFSSEQGILETIIDGEKVEGTWSPHDDAMMCKHIIAWMASAVRTTTAAMSSVSFQTTTQR